MKPFDEIFREKLKEALNNYEAGHLAAKGWDSFMEKRKAGTRRLFIMPLWAKAASLLIIISAGTILTYKILTRQEEAAKVITLSQPVLADSAGQAAAEATPEELVTVPGRLAARNDIGSLKNTTTERSSLLPVKTVKTGDHAAAVQEDIAVNRMVENEPERRRSGTRQRELRGGSGSLSLRLRRRFFRRD